ncbi:head-tail joining protein [Aliarcobacter butzleri]|uniref:Uncharacterized protein n=1 Tax=Aliarcobacter butzleri L348 TaxID=1447256 RepID=A0A0G9K226_9BACT|nr:hypothetical protein [Aliarcobacter butzleri]KLE00577.1 hypothetical protein AA20_05330 [Aliarcobacter butzleri L348]MCG3680251.1 hypothetical protein [Aliarcobacter butzleri]
MSLKDDMKADLSVFYNADEFAKKCIYKGNEVAILYRKNDLEMFEVNFESIKARKVDFEGLEEGDVLEIEGVLYTVMNFSPEKDFQISISIKEK